ncbi:chaperonin GroEL [bacterium]|nr:chaperonin GroEL [bacterium]
MAKQILYDDKARVLLKAGIDKVANAVKITLGPRGRNVVLEKSYGAPTITNDGVSIAKEITLSDKVENMGAEIIKEVASKTNDVAGDGTTTAVVLAQAFVSEGMKLTSLGASGMGVREGIEAAAGEIVLALQKIAKPIKDHGEVKQVATISAESEEVGKIIADTIEKVGKDGVVTVEESQSLGIESEVVEGMQFDKGYVSPYMITNSDRMEAEYSDPAILITDKKISSIKDILPLLEKIVQSGKKDLVIIADDVDGEALTTFVLNKLRGTFNVLAVKSPGYGDRKKEILGDIAATVGASVISEELGVKLESAEVKMLGSARKIIATKDSTTIVGGKGKKGDIDDRVHQIRKQIEMTDSKFDKEKLEERLAKLSGGVAVIKVGAATETEMKYLKLKIEDAVNATRAAIAEGIVPGGGVALLKAVASVVNEKDKKFPKRLADMEFKAGFEMVLRAVEAPLKQIATNAMQEGAVVVDRVRNMKGNGGYDAKKNEYVADMLAAGIIDPLKVTRSCIQNAASAAAILLTTEVAISEEPKEEKPMPGGGMPGMGGGMEY